MSRSLNKIALIGYTGSDPEVRNTAGGTRVANVSLATSRTWKDDAGQEQERTEWHRLTFWGRLAEIAEQYIRKGDRLYVEGRMQYGSYERDGVTIPTADVQVQELVMLGSPNGSRSSSSSPSEPATADSSPGSPLDGPDDDLPF